MMMGRGLAMFLVMAAGATLTAKSSHAQGQARAPYDRFCLVDDMLSYPGDCYYATLDQCRASASGRQAYCQINPAYQFPEDGPAPKRRHRKR